MNLYDCMWKYADRQHHIYKVNNYTIYILCKNKFTFELHYSVIAYVEFSPVTPPGLSLNYNQARSLQHPNTWSQPDINFVQCITYCT